ncbi:MAG: hypothetical protein U0939_12660 [Pirellulales bacterium]
MSQNARARLHPSTQSPSAAPREDLAAIFLDRIDGYRRRHEPSATPAPPPRSIAPPAHEFNTADDDDGAVDEELADAVVACATTAACRAEQLEPEARDLVILVHGTYAGRAEDERRS